MYMHTMYFRNLIVSFLMVLLIPVVAAAQPSGVSGGSAVPDDMPSYNPYELAENIRYPEFALDNGIEGEVILRALVGKNGRVTQIVVRKSTRQDMEKAAKDALLKTRISPATKDGEPVAVWIEIPISFRLDKAKPDSLMAGLPEAGEFVQTDEEPGYDPTALSRSVIYPPDAIRNNIEGRVVIRALLDRTGKVVRTRVDTCHQEVLCPAAVNAVRQTVFTPAKHKGQPVAVWIQIPVEFRLN